MPPATASHTCTPSSPAAHDAPRVALAVHRERPHVPASNVISGAPPRRRPTSVSRPPAAHDAQPVARVVALDRAHHPACPSSVAAAAACAAAGSNPGDADAARLCGVERRRPRRARAARRPAVALRARRAAATAIAQPPPRGSARLSVRVSSGRVAAGLHLGLGGRARPRRARASDRSDAAQRSLRRRADARLTALAERRARGRWHAHVERACSPCAQLSLGERAQRALRAPPVRPPLFSPSSDTASASFRTARPQRPRARAPRHTPRRWWRAHASERSGSMLLAAS